MIDEKMLNAMGLSPQQIRMVLEAVNAERLYQAILCEEGINPRTAIKIVNYTQLKEINMNNELLVKEKVRDTWSGLMKGKGIR